MQTAGAIEPLCLQERAPPCGKQERFQSQRNIQSEDSHHNDEERKSVYHEKVLSTWKTAQRQNQTDQTIDNVLPCIFYRSLDVLQVVRKNYVLENAFM